MEKRALKVFLILCIVFSAIFEALYIILARVTGVTYDFLIFMLMWVPGITGIICTRKYFPRQNYIGIRIKGGQYIFWGIFIPIIYLFISYKLAWMIFSDPTTGFGVVPDAFGCADIKYPIVFWVIFSIIGLLGSCLSALGEELGWRGFMVPTMAKVMDKKKAYILSGIIWSVWHMPLMLAGLYEADTVMWYGLLMFVCELTIMSVIMAVIREKSNSVIPAVLIHASHNLYDQSVLQTVTTDKRVPYLAGETGVLTVVIAGIILVILLWAVKRKEYQF